MIDANTAALERHMDKQDAADIAYVIYGPQAHENVARRIIETRAHDVLDMLADDLIDALGPKWKALRRAIADGDPREAGSLLLDAADRCVDQLITSHEVADEITRLQQEEGL